MANFQSYVSGSELWQWRNAAVASALATDIPIKEVDWLLQEVAGVDSLALRLESYKNWSVIQLQLPLKDLEQLWQRRLNDRLPVQYIAGVTPWRQFKIAVDHSVLIPRPETECLIDLAQDAIGQAIANLCLDQGNWADLGTGSGAVALGLAYTFPQMTIHAVDYSQQALLVAQKNASTLGMGARIQFYQGSWWQPLEFLKGKFSGMISNPPYIPTGLLANLQPEVINHEPHLALDGGFDGLDCIRHLIEVSPSYLRSGGVWLIEMMSGQAQIVQQMLENNSSYYNIQIHSDLAGIERFALAYVN